MVTKLTLVRHGQSVGNAAGCFTGQTDVALSLLGQKEAELTGNLLASEAVSAIYSSDLQRAYNTAQQIARHHNLQITKCLELRELNLGDFQGKSFIEVERDYPQEFAALTQRDLNVVIPGGESHGMMRGRVINKLLQIISQHKDQHIILVVHGGVIFHINHYILSITGDRTAKISYKITNCSLHRYELWDDERWRVITLNDDAHLRELREAKNTSQNNEFQLMSEKIFGCSQ